MWTVPKRGGRHLESVRFNARSHGPRSAQSTCLLGAAAVQTPARRALLGSCQVPSETLAPLSDSVPIPRFKVAGQPRGPAASSCGQHLSEAAFTPPREGKHRGLGAHVLARPPESTPPLPREPSVPADCTPTTSGVIRGSQTPHSTAGSPGELALLHLVLGGCRLECGVWFVFGGRGRCM